MNLAAIAPRQWGIIDPEGHRNRRRINRLRFQRCFHRQRADRVRHGRLGHARQADDIARDRLFDVLLRKSPEGLNSGDAELFDLLAYAAERLNRCADFQRAGFNPSRQHPTNKGIRAQRGRQHGEILILMRKLTRGRDVIDHQVEQRAQILARTIKIHVAPTRPPRGVKMREIKLVLIGIQRGKQIETFIQRPIRFGIGLIHLVQHHNWAQPQRKRLGGHKFGLRHRPFGRINQQNHTIHHRQDTLDLATEISVTGRVDDIDPGAFPFDGCGLGQNGDPAFAFQIIAVHGAFIHRLSGPECSGLFQQFIHKRGFAMVDMGDDRNIAQIHCFRTFIGELAAGYRAGSGKASEKGRKDY